MRLDVFCAVALCLGLGSVTASGGVVDDYCQSFKQRYDFCLQYEEDDAVLALPSDAKIALFRAINTKRNSALESGAIKRTPVPVCEDVIDFGQLPKNSGVWVVKCEKNKMYGIQFDGDVVQSGMHCDFLSSMMGAACSSANWILESESGELVVEIAGVEAEEAENLTESAVTSYPLEFAGLYQRETKADQWKYLRFFSDGTVVAVSSTGTPDQVASWLTHTYINRGKFERDGNTIHFQTTSPSGTVEYSGSIRETVLVLNTYSRINEHRASGSVFKFVSVEDL